MRKWLFHWHTGNLFPALDAAAFFINTQLKWSCDQLFSLPSCRTISATHRCYYQHCDCSPVHHRVCPVLSVQRYVRIFKLSLTSSMSLGFYLPGSHSLSSLLFVPGKGGRARRKVKVNVFSFSILTVAVWSCSLQSRSVQWSQTPQHLLPLCSPCGSVRTRPGSGLLERIGSKRLTAPPFHRAAWFSSVQYGWLPMLAWPTITIIIVTSSNHDNVYHSDKVNKGNCPAFPVGPCWYAAVYHTELTGSVWEVRLHLHRIAGC